MVVCSRRRTWLHGSSAAGMPLLLLGSKERRPMEICRNTCRLWHVPILLPCRAAGWGTFGDIIWREHPTPLILIELRNPAYTLARTSRFGFLRSDVSSNRRWWEKNPSPRPQTVFLVRFPSRQNIVGREHDVSPACLLRGTYYVGNHLSSSLHTCLLLSSGATPGHRPGLWRRPIRHSDEH